MEEEPKLPPVPAKLALDDVENLSHDALKTALKSIIREKGPIGTGELMHRNHNSHSNVW
ncbi:hypothetical protein [Spirosoma montaniterrae]|uniref:hypothetical protein n=1 Tax=Spirosoma montaniterrae TaxID=1178516 RepID=UPI0012F7B9C9|nr:hypothetical protein [Spirosoma montaniterrae]